MPKSPLSMINALEKQNYVSEWFPVTDILPDFKTCVTRHGTLVQVLRLRGIDYTALTAKERENYFFSRKTFFEKIDPTILVSVFACRRKHKRSYTDQDYGNKYAQEIAEKASKRFKTSFSTDIFIVIKERANTLINDTGIGSRDLHKEQATLMARANAFAGQVETLKNTLEAFSPEILHHSEKDHSDLIDFWSYLLNGGSHSKATTRTMSNLEHIIGNCDIEFMPREPVSLFGKIKENFQEHDGGQGLYQSVIQNVSEHISKGNYAYVRFSGLDQERYGAICYLKYYPQVSEDKLFDNLLSIQQEFCLVQHFSSIDKEVALQNIQTSLERLMNFGRFIGSKADDFGQYAESLSADDFQHLEHSFHIIVYDNDYQALDEGVARISSSLVSSGINIKREEGFTEAAYWSQFPDYEDLTFPRRVGINSITGADFCTFGSKPTGNERCAFGDSPVSYFKTTDGQNYAFTFHPTADKSVAGNTLIVGQPGSGKTLTSASFKPTPILPSRPI